MATRLIKLASDFLTNSLPVAIIDSIIALIVLKRRNYNKASINCLAF